MEEIKEKVNAPKVRPKDEVCKNVTEKSYSMPLREGEGKRIIKRRMQEISKENAGRESETKEEVT